MATEFEQLFHDIISVEMKFDNLENDFFAVYMQCHSCLYSGQGAIIMALDEWFYENIHSFSGNHSNYCMMLSRYIEFREEYNTINADMLSLMLAPQLSLNAKKIIKEQLNLSNRETLDFIYVIRERASWIISFGGHDAFIEALREYAPDFDPHGDDHG